MNRRAFSRLIAMSAGSILAPTALARASQSCSVATQTPFGVMQRCTAGVDDISFQSAAQSQHASEWCWAASISMVFDYYNHPVSQERIVNDVWGGIVNMPSGAPQILRSLNRRWTDDNGDRFQSFGDPLSANNLNAVLDLRQNRPLIIGALGHATVLTALTSDINVQTNAWQVVQATVQDPWPTSGGERALSLVEWLHISFAARVRVQDL